VAAGAARAFRLHVLAATGLILPLKEAQGQVTEFEELTLEPGILYQI
jgi:hypothetical protein